MASVWETIGIYVLIPAAVYGAFFALTVGRGRARRPRYRVGQPWNHEPLFWSANPAGTGLPAGTADDPTAATGRGGARGSW